MMNGHQSEAKNKKVGGGVYPNEVNEHIIIHTRIYDFYTFKERAFVHFGRKIIHVGDMNSFQEYFESLSESQKEDVTVIDGSEYLVLPGLIAAHTHIYSTFARGMSISFSPKSFQDVLTQLWWKMDDQLTNEETYYSGLAAGLEYIKSGVTTIFDHHASGEILNSLDMLKTSLCDDIGIRGGFCFETSDRYDVQACLLENQRFMIQCEKELEEAESCHQSFGLFGLHASMSLSEETLKKVKQWVGDRPIHIHVAESEEDQNDCMKRYGKRVVERLHDFGLLNKFSILAHCLYIDENEAALIAKQKCTIALNVTSNMNNSVGLPNIELYRRWNIPCMVGNDGMTTDIASEYRNLLFTMHLQTKSPVGFGLEELLVMVRNGYDYGSRALGCQIGRLEVGYESDLLAITYNPPTPITSDNIFGHIIYGLAHRFQPIHVWCRGRHVIHHYMLNKHFYHDILTSLHQAPHIAQHYWNKID